MKAPRQPSHGEASRSRSVACPPHCISATHCVLARGATSPRRRRTHPRYDLRLERRTAPTSWDSWLRVPSASCKWPRRDRYIGYTVATQLRPSGEKCSRSRHPELSIRVKRKKSPRTSTSISNGAYFRKATSCGRTETSIYTTSQARDHFHRPESEICAIQLVGAEAASGGVTMIAAVSPGMPVAPVLPVGPAGPAGPGTATGAGGTFTTAAGLSQAAIPNTASTDMRIERIMKAPFRCGRRVRKQVVHWGPTAWVSRTGGWLDSLGALSYSYEYPA